MQAKTIQTSQISRFLQIIYEKVKSGLADLPYHILALHKRGAFLRITTKMIQRIVYMVCFIALGLTSQKE